MKIQGHWKINFINLMIILFELQEAIQSFCI